MILYATAVFEIEINDDEAYYRAADDLMDAVATLDLRGTRVALYTDRLVVEGTIDEIETE